MKSYQKGYLQVTTCYQAQWVDSKCDKTRRNIGRRPVLVSSLLGYVIVVFLIPWSDNIYVLLFLRLLQGIFAAGIGVIARALLTDAFTGKTLKKYASYITFAWAIGSIFSPYLGGYLQHYFGWQAVFYFLSIYSTTVFLLVAIFLRETIPNRHRFQLPVITKNYKHVLTHKIFVAGALSCGLGG